MVPIFSLAGVPPLSGFLGKLAILEGTFAAGAYWVGGIVLVVGLLTLLSMGRAWADGFWRPQADGGDVAAPGTPLLIVIARTERRDAGDHRLARDRSSISRLRAAQQLLQRDDYIQAVLRGVLLTCSSAASCWRLRGRRCKARSRSSTW